MRYGYKKDGDKWVFCYELDSETEKVVDQIMPEAVEEFRGDKNEQSMLRKSML